MLHRCLVTTVVRRYTSFLGQYTLTTLGDWMHQTISEGLKNGIYSEASDSTEKEW